MFALSLLSLGRSIMSEPADRTIPQVAVRPTLLPTAGSSGAVDRPAEPAVAPVHRSDEVASPEAREVAEAGVPEDTAPRTMEPEPPGAEPPAAGPAPPRPAGDDTASSTASRPSGEDEVRVAVAPTTVATPAPTRTALPFEVTDTGSERIVTSELPRRPTPSPPSPTPSEPPTAPAPTPSPSPGPDAPSAPASEAMPGASDAEPTEPTVPTGAATASGTPTDGAPGEAAARTRQSASPAPTGVPSPSASPSSSR